VKLAQVGVFGARLLQDGKLRVGILPQRQEILISHTARWEVSFEGTRARQTKHSQSRLRRAGRQPAMVEDFLEFRFSRFAIGQAEVDQPAEVRGIESSFAFALAQVVRPRGLKSADGCACVPTFKLGGGEDGREPQAVQQGVGGKTLA